MPQEEPSRDFGRDLIFEMVKNMAVLAKSNELLAQKTEDLTAALDDVRERMDSSFDLHDETSGYLGAILRIAEEMAEIGSKEDAVLKWGDLKKVIRDMKKEAESEAEESEEEEEEVGR
jgi:hypothetical protein